MKEKVFKKGIKKRLFSVILTFAIIVVSVHLGSSNVYADTVWEHYADHDKELWYDSAEVRPECYEDIVLIKCMTCDRQVTWRPGEGWQDTSGFFACSHIVYEDPIGGSTPDPTPDPTPTPSIPAPFIPALPIPAPSAPTLGKQYEEVTSAAGFVKDITNSGEATAETNHYSASIVNSSALETLVNVTPEEKAQGVNVWIEIVDASSTMPAADKAAIQSVAGNNTIGMYLDATLFKKVGSGNPTKVSNANGKVKISIVVPENLRKPGRTYEIIRVHDGVPTVIQGTYDANTYTFTFETDQFSSYAIAYNDSNKISTTAPKTGDVSALWYLLLIVSVGGMFTLGYLNKKKRML